MAGRRETVFMTNRIRATARRSILKRRSKAHPVFASRSTLVQSLFDCTSMVVALVRLFLTQSGDSTTSHSRSDSLGPDALHLRRSVPRVAACGSTGPERGGGVNGHVVMFMFAGVPSLLHHPPFGGIQSLFFWLGVRGMWCCLRCGAKHGSGIPIVDSYPYSGAPI